MEEWVTLYLYGTQNLECCMCRKPFMHQIAHMYKNTDYEIEEVLCEKCWEKEKQKK